MVRNLKGCKSVFSLQRFNLSYYDFMHPNSFCKHLQWSDHLAQAIQILKNNQKMNTYLLFNFNKLQKKSVNGITLSKIPLTVAPIVNVNTAIATLHGLMKM